MGFPATETNDENVNGADGASIVTSPEPSKGDYQMVGAIPNRTEVPLFMLIHQQNTPIRANPDGYRLFDYMTSVIHIELFEPTTVLVRSKGSKNLFRMHQQLFEVTFIHIPLAYGSLPGINEPVYTFHIGSDLTVSRFVRWAYYNEYPEYINLDSPARIRMPTSRYSSLDEYLLQVGPRRISSLTSAINIAVDRDPVPYGEQEPNVYSQAQEESVTDSYPFAVHLRMYIFAAQHGLNLLQYHAFIMAQSCCEDGRALQMRPDRQKLVWGCIRNLSTFIQDEDPMMGFIHYILQCFHPQP